MIIVDTTETRSTSRMPNIPGAVVSDVLESISGADLMISPLTGIPATTETLIRLHVAEGALLAQRKSGLDLCSSIGPRLYGSLARMRAIGGRQWQDILLTTGVFLPNVTNGMTLVGTPHFHDDGRVTFNWQTAPRLYKSMQSALRHWTWYGGVHLSLACDDEIAGWCKVTESRLAEKREAGVVKEVWPDGSETLYDPPAEDDPLQELRVVKDWRAAFVVAFRGVGPVLATNLREAMLDFGCQDKFYNALFWASAEDPDRWGLPKVKGWGPKMRLVVRETLGLQPGQDIRLDWRGEGE